MPSLFDGPNGRRTYSSLSDAEKWRYHTHCYAFRMVYLGMPETTRSWEGDPSGRWFDADMTAKEVGRLQRQKDLQDGRAKRAGRDDPRDDPHVKAQRAAWIKFKGYPSWEACLDDMWRDAEAHKNAEGQPDALGALRRSGLIGFSAQWKEWIIRTGMAHRQGRPSAGPPPLPGEPT